MEKKCKVCSETKHAVNDFYKGVNVCKKCKAIQQRLRNSKVPIPDEYLVRKTEFDYVCSVCDTQKPSDHFRKGSYVCKGCISERQKFYANKIPLPDRLRVKVDLDAHRIDYTFPEKVDPELKPLSVSTSIQRYEHKNGMVLYLEYCRNGKLLHTYSETALAN